MRTTYARPVAVVIALFLAACTSTPRQTTLMRTQSGLEVSTAELRVRVRAMAPRMVGIIQAAATEVVLAHPHDLRVRQETRLWMTHAIPEMQRSLFQPDPMAAVVDVAAYVMQTTFYFTEGLGSKQSEEVLSIVLTACNELKAEVDNMLRLIDPDRDPVKGWARVEKWARNHPIEAHFSARASTVQLLARFTASEHRGGLKAVSQVSDQIDDLAGRLDLLTATAPALARATTAYLLEALLARDDVSGLLTGAEEIPGKIETISHQIPYERELILESVTEESQVIREWARAERLETLTFVSAERLAILGAVEAERTSILEAVQAEREAILATIHAERIATMQDLQVIVGESLITARVEVVDHAIDRLAVLGGLALLVVVILTVFVTFMLRGSLRG